jgi:hypothetical protein
MAKNNQQTESKPSAKILVKSILGQFPFTAELYWLMRHRDKTINSRFSLKNLEEQLPQITEYLKEKKPSRGAGKKIFLFGSLHYWIEHAALIGLELSALGHDVTLGFLPYHDWQNEINKFDLRRQNIYAQKILEKTEPFLHNLPMLNLHAGYKMLPEDLQESITQVARYDAMYTLQVESVDETSSIYKMRLKRNLLAGRAAYVWMEENQPDVVVVPNGTIQEFGVVYEVARYLGIPVVTYEFGDQRQRIWLAQNAKVMRQETHAMWEAFKDKPLTRTELARIRELFEARKKASVWKNFSRLWQQVPSKGMEIAREELGLDERTVVLLATNVLGDSLTLGRELFSQNMEEWLERTLQYFAGKPEVQLVIRVHPGEVLIHGQSMVDVINHVLPQLPPHIRVIGPKEKVNTYDLIAAADVGLVYTTTVGLEMAMSGVPVIVAGNTHYREKGFTQDADSWVRYHKLLKEVLEDPEKFRLSQDQLNLAWAYAYRFFFDFPRPFPWHLLQCWEDYENSKLEDLERSREWKTYRQVFAYLAGEEIDWAAIRDHKAA